MSGRQSLLELGCHPPHRLNRRITPKTRGRRIPVGA
jgi:hypothetical protein